MANKRNLKRNINDVCGELFTEVVAASQFGDKVGQEDVKALLASVLVIHSDYIRRVSHIEPGMKPKTFFKALSVEFNKQVSEIIDQVANLG